MDAKIKLHSQDKVVRIINDKSTSYSIKACGCVNVKTGSSLIINKYYCDYGHGKGSHV